MTVLKRLQSWIRLEVPKSRWTIAAIIALAVLVGTQSYLVMLYQNSEQRVMTAGRWYAEVIWRSSNAHLRSSRMVDRLGIYSYSNNPKDWQRALEEFDYLYADIHDLNNLTNTDDLFSPDRLEALRDIVDSIASRIDNKTLLASQHPSLLGEVRTILLDMGRFRNEAAAAKQTIDDSLREQIGKSSEIFWVASLLNMAAGLGILSFVWIAYGREVDKLKRENTERRGRLELLGALAGGLAHVTNSTLATINGYAARIRKTAITGQEEDIGQILSASGKLTKVTRELMILSRRADAPNTEKLDISVILREAEELIRENLPDTIQLRVTRPVRGAIHVTGNANNLQIALAELAENASRAILGMPEGDRPEEGLVEIFAERRVRDVVFTVVDNGPGIPTEQHSRVVEPFFTTRQTEGFGLGLTSVKILTEAMGGQLTLYSPVDGGLAVELSLPNG
ncbi:ATP-binding protein [Coralliovum pocilloporae]|uniref:ATP-binding protein n=1 Tax=Coralliovum pocilloporae TaxID=3066369 RepID=UPI003307B341